MRILYVVHQFFPKWYTGTERFILDLAKQMRRMGHYVEVLTYGFDDDTGFSVCNGVMYKKYTFQTIPVTSIRHLTVPDDLSYNIFDDKIENILFRVMTKGNFDIVHVAHPMRLGCVFKVAKSLGLPTILTLTDFWLICPKAILVTSKGHLCKGSEDGIKCTDECFFTEKTIRERFTHSNEISDSVDYIVSPTHFLKKMFEVNNFSPNIKLMPFSIDYNDVESNLKEYLEKSDITLGFLSTLLPHKGAHVLLNAFNEAKMSNIKLKIYGHYFGAVDYYNTLKSFVKDNRVEFCGAYNYEEIPKILDEIDILVVPSIWWENSPLILLRALAHNVPAIVSDLGGMTEVINDGENGFVFEAGNAQSLAEILRKIGEDPIILNEMKARIRHPPRIEEEAFEYEMVYSSLIS